MTDTQIKDLVDAPSLHSEWKNAMTTMKKYHIDCKKNPKHDQHINLYVSSEVRAVAVSSG